MARGSSPTSSRKRVPPSAASKSPTRFRSAPVKAPFSWPKSSLSRRDSGSAAQFTATKGPARRGARPVQGPRDQLLAGAALAEQEHGGVAVRHRPDLLEQGLDRRGAAHHTLEAELPLHLRAERCAFSGAAAGSSSARRMARVTSASLKRLGEVVVGALAHGLDGGLQAAERGHEQTRVRGGRARPGRGETSSPPTSSMMRSVRITS